MAKRRADLEVSPKDKAIEAVKVGDKEEALKYIEELYQLPKGYHDRAVEIITFFLDLVANKMGGGAVEEAWRGIGKAVFEDRYISVFKTMTPEEIARYFALVHISHYSDFYIEEDEEKFVVYISYCGTGGKMQKERKGDSVSKAYPWSYDEKGVSYYCAHESIFNKLFREWGYDRIKFEYGRQFDEKGKPAGGVCRYIIYKNKP
ncbi:hypothetical protein ACFLXF_01905 [Chloroflexota bacterium]